MQDSEQTDSSSQAKQETQPGAPDQGRFFPVEFTGRAGEYFKIWIVNLFLSIITLSIYSAWAKVRTRRYFYANTRIDGQAFDYLANPVRILIGHLIVTVLFIGYSISGRFDVWISGGFVLLFYLILPYLIYKSIRFYTHNSAYRGIRFRFDGTLWESYQLYLLAPVLIPLTLGFYFPYWVHLQKRWFFENTAFGGTSNEFDGKPGMFYKTYFLATVQVILIMISFGLIAGLVAYFSSSGFESLRSGMQNTDMFFKIGMVIGFVGYFVMLLGAAVVQQYVFARITNYCWQQSQLGDIRIHSDLKARKLFWIRLTNILAIVFSVGLLIPWAKVRRARYITSCMHIEMQTGFDRFAAAAGKEVSAVGDAATEFFDFEIGL
jgi:uncharacterized membrane protein YjgN (DUF898 family)